MKYPKIAKHKRLAYLQEIRMEALELTLGSREEAREMYEYLRGNQLPYDVVALLERRG